MQQRAQLSLMCSNSVLSHGLVGWRYVCHNVQVWVKPEVKEDGKIYWQADSDSQLTKGLAALLVLGLSGCTPAEILSVQPTFIELLGLKQSLTPSRSNGFLNMFLKMQKLTLGLVVASTA